MILAGLAELALAFQTQTRETGIAVHDASQFWAQLVTAGVILGVGTWAVRDHLSLRREIEGQRDQSADRYREMEERLEGRGDTRHEQYLQTIAKLAEGQAVIQHLMLGIQGHGGLIQDKQKNQERRHELAQDITVLYAILREQGIQLARVSEKLSLPFDPVPIERAKRRRSGEVRDDG